MARSRGKEREQEREASRETGKRERRERERAREGEIPEPERGRRERQDRDGGRVRTEAQRSQKHHRPRAGERLGEGWYCTLLLLVAKPNCFSMSVSPTPECRSTCMNDDFR